MAHTSSAAVYNSDSNAGYRQRKNRRQLQRCLMVMAADIQQQHLPLTATAPHKAAPGFLVSACSRSSDLLPGLPAGSQFSSPLQVIDLAPCISGASQDCERASTGRQVAESLHQTGCLVVRDPRVAVGDSNCFLDLMERYFCQATSVKLLDARPTLHYQVSDKK